jgi:hypothetical protein
MTSVLERETERLRRMTAEEKLRISEALWREAWMIKRASLASRHPHWSDLELEEATRRSISGT